MTLLEKQEIKKLANAACLSCGDSSQLNIGDNSLHIVGQYGTCLTSEYYLECKSFIELHKEAILEVDLS